MTTGRMTRARRLSPLVRLVVAPNPSPMTLEGTNTYLIGGDSPIVLDPGPADEAHLDRLVEEAGEVAMILLTHWHPDHAEGASALARRCGVAIASAVGWHDEALAISDGEEIAVPDGGTLRAVATPGHASDHLCFLLPEERALFTGDHILGFGTSVVTHPDGDMEAYLRSLERLRDLEVRRMYPGHGPVIDEPREVLEHYVRHRLEREEQVLAALASTPLSVGEIVAEVYAGVDEVLHPVAAQTVRAHLGKLEREGAVAEEAGRWRRT